jgi:hypothetical protein
VRSWYTNWLLDEIIYTKNQVQLFKRLGEKHPVAQEIAFTLSKEMKRLIQELVNRKKQQNDKNTLSF